MWIYSVIACVTALLQWTAANNYSYVVNTFVETDSGVTFSHMVRDDETGNLYIAATNTLYKLNESLLKLQTNIIGPVEDSPSCVPSTLDTCLTKRSTSILIKSMVINKKAGRLIVCMNVFQGTCRKYMLGNINVVDGLSAIKAFLVPNDVDSSNIVLLAPGKEADSEVLYFGTERTSYESLYDWYAVSTRNPGNFQLVLRDSLQGYSGLKRKASLTSFKIQYLYGFSYDGFSYFLVVQKADPSQPDAPYITKLARVCQKDNKYISYTEVPLKCTASTGTDYNRAQAAYLATPGRLLFDNLGMNTQTDKQALFVLFSVHGSNESAMCVYSMWNIVTKFTYNIKQCFQGKGNKGPIHFAPSDQCTKVSESAFPIRDDYCGQYNINFPIGTNNWPIEGSPVITWRQSVTAIAVTATKNFTVAFVGTSDGNIKKVVVETKNSATQYSEIAINPGHKILPDLVFGENGKYLYVLTDNKVTRIKVEECEKYQGCSKCIIESSDPYCGWCTLESKCSTHGTCTNSNLQKHWLPYNNKRCTEITYVSPNMTQIKDDQQTLNINIQNLPTVSGVSYQCAFYMREGSQPLLTDGVKTENGITCMTPPKRDLPNIPTGMDHITMRLAVRSNGQDFVATDYSFFDCSRHTSCTSCTNSQFPCTFCVRQHKCTHNREGCGSDVMVTGIKVPGRSDRRGPDHCPRILSSDNKIAVASGFSKTVEVQAANLLSIQQAFFCKFNMNGMVKKAQKNGDRITCQQEVFSYNTDAPTHLVPFQVVWQSGSRENALDNPDNIQVLIYKCSKLAESGGTPNCGNCLTLDTKYQCGWCRESNTCTVGKDCVGGKTWLMRSSTCPDPQITSISPTSGPLNGGTKVTITGINLGKSIIDIRNGVTVAGVPCVVIEKDYVKTSRIVCETGSTRSSKNGRVTVGIAGQYSAASKAEFSYVLPTISNFEPKMGIEAGGTLVTITGNHLNAGTEISVKFGVNLCTVKSTSEREAVCETSTGTKSESGRITVQFDKQEIVGYNLPNFLYKGNPNITSYGRGVGFKMGGLEETIEGTNFDAVQDPKLFIDYNGRRYFGKCSRLGEKALRCISPSLTSAVSKRAASDQEAVYGMKIENLEKTSPSVFRLYPDPVIVEFPDGEHMISKKIESLKIEGSNLSPTLTKADIRVSVGSGDCVVTLLVPASDRDQKTTDEIHCDLPVPEDGVNEYTVQVTVGSITNHTFTVGTLMYEDEEVLPLWAKILLGAVGVVMIIVVVSVTIAYKRKSRQSDKQVQQMHHQMDVLETKVAKECKEAFAELQTDMTEMTNDLGGLIGMPFLDYKSFCMRVLFPNCNEFDHPVVRELEVDYIHQDSLERGLRQFDQLMNNKTFLLLFIRTLEADKHFSMKDRVNVASLVSVALQGKMEYMTDILKTLLSDLIERSIEGKNHPKLLLRRTQSVAEKMLTNWFTFLLYKFLKECAGEPLFMLFRAIKQQVEKGPIDAVSGEAKYSLSEDKLIRQQMDYKSLTIYVIEAETYNSQQHPVKVLDVDTISQVKEKILDAIFKNAPFSSRHSKDELDLEWHTGASGRVTLQDEDRMSTKSDDGGYKRVNTLQHYGVPDNAIMSLITKQQQYNQSDRSVRSRDYDNSYLTSSPSMSHIRSPNSSNLDVEAGSKLYHLVKPQDSDVQKEGERGSKMVSEIYLTRLLATKGTLQQFVDDLFETLFSTAHRGSALPLAIKYLFDFLDDQALLYGITDPETVHTWKSNSLPLRFWVNVIKNPNFVFDVYKSSIVDSCLSVVAQTFMDSCSMSDHRLGKDSPATKLLYAKDIPKYKKWVERYYQDIKLMPAISDQDMNALLAEESRMHQSEFNTLAALNELYKYATKYNEQLHQTLEEDEFARKNRLSHRLEQVHMCMETEV